MVEIMIPRNYIFGNSARDLRKRDVMCPAGSVAVESPLLAPDLVSIVGKRNGLRWSAGLVKESLKGYVSTSVFAEPVADFYLTLHGL